LRAYVDTNIFVYSMFAHPKYGMSCRTIIDDLESGALEGVVSTLVPVEILGVVIKHNPSRAQLAVTSICSLPMDIIEISRGVLSLAPETAVRYHLSGYDAVHIAASLDANIEYFISNDDDLRRVEEIELVKPLEYSEWKKKQ